MASPLQRVGSVARVASPTRQITSRARRKTVQCTTIRRQQLSGTACFREDRRGTNPNNTPRKPSALWRNPYVNIVEESYGLKPQKDYQPRPEGMDELEQAMAGEIGDDVQGWVEKAHNELGQLGLPSIDEVAADIQKLDAESGYNDLRDEMQPPAPPKVNAIDDYEEPEELEEEDPEFEQDDITSDAHLELEQVRELRQMSRTIVWDMPLLYRKLCNSILRGVLFELIDWSEYRKPFQPPTNATPLKFRYTTYLGEVHPAARKVVVTFNPSNLPDLTSVQADKIIKLLGVRYNPSTKEAKLSCEMFPTIAQNKRYLGDLVDKLMTEAKDGKDTFADIPFDFRHHKPKKEYVFPEDWKLTEQRRQELAARWRETQVVEDQRISSGGLIEGADLANEGREHELVEASRFSPNQQQAQLRTQPR